MNDNIRVRRNAYQFSRSKCHDGNQPLKDGWVAKRIGPRPERGKLDTRPNAGFCPKHATLEPSRELWNRQVGELYDTRPQECGGYKPGAQIAGPP